MIANLTKLFLSGLLSQALLLLSTPLITRIFSPNAIGIAATFSALYAIVIPISTLKYDVAIPIVKEKRKAYRLVLLCTVLATCCTAAIIFALLIINTFSIHLELSYEYNLVPIAIWIGAVYTLTQQWSARICNYKPFAISQVLSTTSNIATSLTLALIFGGNPLFLIIGIIVGQSVGFAYMVKHDMFKSTKISPAQLYNLVRLAREFRQFPQFVFPSIFLISASQNVLQLVVNYFYSDSTAGQFAVANRLLIVPSALIGGALSETFRSEFLKRVRNNQNKLLFLKRSLMSTVLIAMCLFSIFSVLAPTLFIIVYGQDFDLSGYIFRSMCIGAAFQFIALPFNQIFVALERTRLGFLIQGLFLAIPLAVIVCAGIMAMPIINSLFLYAITTAILTIFSLCMAYIICSRSDLKRLELLYD